MEGGFDKHMQQEKKKKVTWDIDLTPFTIINSKWITYLNVKL
jgi:hypothetical protein